MKNSQHNNNSEGHTQEILPYHKFMEIFDINRTTADRWRKEGRIKVYALKRRLYVKYSEVTKSLFENEAPMPGADNK